MDRLVSRLMRPVEDAWRAVRFHTQRRQQVGHHAGRPQKRVAAFNDWLAARITAVVSTMWCAYAFVLLAASGFPGLRSTPTQLVQWFSQTFLQLVFLPILAVGTAVLSRASERRHNAIETRMERMEREHGVELRALHELLADLHSHTTCAGHTVIGETERPTAVYPVTAGGTPATTIRPPRKRSPVKKATV